MASDDGLKISFCTSCRGADYLERLKKTLPENIRLNTGDGNYNNVEFVVVAYGDPEVTKWLKENYANEIKSGLVRAVDLPREQAEFFKMAHAKNVAHRMATGDVLCNLDCDNITGENFSGFLNEKFSKNLNIVASVTTFGRLMTKLTTGVTPSDVTGRIAVSRENYERLHGYNEQNNAAKDQDDTNFKERAYASGLKSAVLPASQLGEIITHSDDDRLANMSPADRAKSKANFSERGSFLQRVGTVKSVLFGEDRVIPRGLTGANPDGNYGCGEVTLLDGNLEPQAYSLEPAPHSQWRSSYRAGASGMQSAGGGHRE